MAKASRPSQLRVDHRTTGLALGLMIIAFVVIGGLWLGLYARGRWWLPPVASAHGPEIDRLFYNTLFITTIVFVGVHLLLGYFVWRYAAHGDRKALYWHENSRLELSYTIIPAIGLAVMVALGGVVWTRLHAAPAGDPIVVDYRAEQFAWLARYPGPDGKFGRVDPRLIDSRRNPMGLDAGDPAGADDIVSRDLHLVVNRPVRVRLRATGVIHSFFVPAFRVKQDAMPGQTIETWFTPTRAGKYEVACAELCGIGHYAMRGNVVVETQQAFDGWLRQQKPALKSGE
jgi:cytochrome c oxidase subunit 2